MNQKAESMSLITIYLSVVIIIGFFLYLGFGGISEVKSIGTKFEVNKFVDTLENSLESQKSQGYGSVNKISLYLPNEVEKVCFLGEKERFSPERSLDVARESKIYPDKNIFFFPSNRFDPEFLDYLAINNSQNPLCVKNEYGQIDLVLTTLTNRTLVEAKNDEKIQPSCLLLPGSSAGNSKDKIDIVFLGYGYSNRTIFADTAINYISETMMKIEPFSSNIKKFNFWLTYDAQPNCTISSYVFCDSFSVNKIASLCPNDYIFILFDKRSLRSSVRSSAISNMAKINTRDNKIVLLHEFGHIFAGLADEYVDSYYESWFDAKDYPNCDYINCPTWSSLDGTDCIKGCSTNSFYRSVEESIMRNYDENSSYGVLSEGVINKNLGEYK